MLPKNYAQPSRSFSGRDLTDRSEFTFKVSRISSRSLRRDFRQGATAVEMALVLPIVFTFFFGAFEFARVAMIRPTVDSAVYDAARRAIIPGATVADVRTAAQRMLATVGIREATINVRPQAFTVDTPEVTVSIDVPLDGNAFVPPNFFRGKRVQRSLTLQREGV